MSLAAAGHCSRRKDATLRFPNALLAVSMLVPVWSCSYGTMLDKMVPKEEVEFAKRYLGDLKAGHFDEVESRLSPELRRPDTRARLQEAASQFPSGEPTSVVLIGSHVFQAPGRWSANLSFQYGFERGWIVANVAVARKEGGLVVSGVHVNRTPDSLERIHAFALESKGAVHYLFLAGAILVPSFLVVVLAMGLRTRDLRRKWLWASFILFGVAGVTINWTTGQIALQPLSIHLFGAGAVRSSPYSPWLVSVAFPLGAVVFLARRRRARDATPVAAIPTTPPS